MIKPKVSVVSKFALSKAIQAAVKRAGGAHVTVGVHADGRAYPGKNAPEPGRVALWMEYGTEHCPPRPFLAPALDQNAGLVKKKMAEALVHMAFQNWSLELGLASLGQTLVILIQNKIKSNVRPSLSGTWDPPSGYLGWKREHGMGQRTLIATGTLYDNVAFKMYGADGARITGDAKKEGKSPPDNGNPQTARSKRAAARAEGAAQKKRASEQRQAAKSAAKEKVAAARHEQRAAAARDKQVQKDFDKFFKGTFAGKQKAASDRAYRAEQRRFAKEEQAEE